MSKSLGRHKRHLLSKMYSFLQFHSRAARACMPPAHQEEFKLFWMQLGHLDRDLAPYMLVGGSGTSWLESAELLPWLDPSAVLELEACVLAPLKQQSWNKSSKHRGLRNGVVIITHTNTKYIRTISQGKCTAITHGISSKIALPYKNCY